MVKNPPANVGDARSPGEGNGNPLQYSCLGNPMDRGAWATVHRITRVEHNLAAKPSPPTSYKCTIFPFFERATIVTFPNNNSHAPSLQFTNCFHTHDLTVSQKNTSSVSSRMQLRAGRKGSDFAHSCFFIL